MQRKPELLIGAVLVTAVFSAATLGCSIFMASLEGSTLFGNNIDDGNPHTFYEIVPATQSGDYGFITLGFNQPQGGLNEAGLAFDTNAVASAPLEPQSALRSHPEGPFGIATEMLRKAATVEQALDIARSYDWGDALTNQWFFADASGDAVVISAGGDGELAFTRKPAGDGYLISTNINRARTRVIRACWRYRTIDRMLGRLMKQRELSAPVFTDILDAAHQEAVFLRDGVLLNTEYSNIYDLQTREITLYYWFQFDEPLVLRLDEELARGPMRVRVASLFPAALVQRAVQINQAHMERLATWRSFPWIPTMIALALFSAIAAFALIRR